MDKEQERQDELFKKMDAFNNGHYYKEPPYTTETESLARYTNSSASSGFP